MLTRCFSPQHGKKNKRHQHYWQNEVHEWRQSKCGVWKCGHRGCVGCDGDMWCSSDFQYRSHRKYHTLEEQQNLVLAGPEGRKGGLYPFKNLKVEQIRKELHERGKDGSGKKQELQERLTDILGGTTRVPALLYGDIPFSLKDLHLEHYEVLFFEPLYCCLNHIAHVLDELPHHITDVDVLVTLKETLCITLKKDKLAALTTDVHFYKLPFFWLKKQMKVFWSCWPLSPKWWVFSTQRKTAEIQSKYCDL